MQNKPSIHHFPVSANVSLTPDTLALMYETHTDSDIAVKFNTTDVMISYWRRKWGIPTVTARQRKDKLLRPGQPTIDNITVEDLRIMQQSMGDRAIAKVYGVSKAAITRIRHKWGVLPISTHDRSMSESTWTDEQRAVVIGMLMGDAHLLERGVLSVWHSHAQLGYVRRIQSVLAPHSKQLRYYEKIIDASGQLSCSFGFRTHQSDWLVDLRKVFYPNGKRIFPIPIINSLTTTSLAYWYFDDGFRDHTIANFALGDISDVDAIHVSNAVGHRFGLETRVDPRSTDSCKIMKIGPGSSDKFFRLVSPYLTDDLSYKVPSIFHQDSMRSKRVVNVQSPVMLTPDLVHRSKNWESLSQPDKALLIDNLVVFWHQHEFPHPYRRPEEIGVVAALTENQTMKDGVMRQVQAGQISCQSFMPNIWRAASFGKISPIELFADDTQLSNVLGSILKSGRVPNAERVRNTCRIWNWSGVYNFRPSAAKTLVDKYCRKGGIVWDPCGGYGGRLFGSVVSNNFVRYVCCEPQPETYAGLHMLTEWMDSCISNVRSRVSLHNIPAEDFDLDYPVDMVLTSPPYWKREVYGDQPTQSSQRYQTYGSWLSGFWRIVLEKACAHVRPGGYILLNVDNFNIASTKYELIDDTKRICVELGLVDLVEIKYEVARFGAQPGHEMILCWMVPEFGVSQYTKYNPTVDIVVAPNSVPIQYSKCNGCGRATKYDALVDGKCVGCSAPVDHCLVCEQCNNPFVAVRRNTRFCSTSCRITSRKHRATLAVPTHRVFTCTTCKNTFEYAGLTGGYPKWCDACRESKVTNGNLGLQQRRTKVCAYHKCGIEFVDVSLKNSSSYCCAKHRNGAKRWRMMQNH